MSSRRGVHWALKNRIILSGLSISLPFPFQIHNRQNGSQAEDETRQREGQQERYPSGERTQNHGENENNLAFPAPPEK